MRPRVLVGTADGLYELGAPTGRRGLEGADVTAVAALDDGSQALALVDGRRVVRGGDGDWEVLAELDGPEATSLLSTPEAVYAGTREAHLLRVGTRGAEPLAGFERVPGRDDWYTPWGGPPDVRSLAADPRDGALYVNVHVGGIPRSVDGGRTWHPTIDVHADVHQVFVHGPTVLAASARGLAQSDDAGRTWRFATAGLHGTYLRAVAVAGDWVLVTASNGPSTRQAAVYRRPLDDPDQPFARAHDGLPEWFTGNVDTGRLAASGATVVLAAPDGPVFVSDDAGATWQQAADRLPPVTCLAVAGGPGQA